MSKGFTLIELLVVIALVALLATIGVPSMTRFMQINRVVANSNDWLTSATQTRVEALKIRQRVDLCASSNPYAATPTCSGNWEDGWLIIADTDADGTVETIIDVHGPVSGDLLIRDNFTGNRVAYNGDGFLRGATGGTIRICGDNSAASDVATEIIVSNTIGRARVRSGVYTGVDCSTDP